MKNAMKMIGIIGLSLVFVLAMIGCSDSGDSGEPENIITWETNKVYVTAGLGNDGPTIFIKESSAIAFTISLGRIDLSFPKSCKNITMNDFKNLNIPKSHLETLYGGIGSQNYRSITVNIGISDPVPGVTSDYQIRIGDISAIANFLRVQISTVVKNPGIDSKGVLRFQNTTLQFNGEAASGFSGVF